MEIILNDETVSEAVKAHEAEMEQLAKPATIEEATAVLSNASPYDLTGFMPKGTIAGEIRRAKKRGVVQSYGFVSSGWGDVFVPAYLMSDYKDDEVVAVLVNEGPRGKAAEKIAPINDFISWHKDEILARVMETINNQKKQEREWKARRDPTNGWDEMKDKCFLLGLELIEVKKYTRSTNYGGRGTDTYKFSRAVTKEEADKVLDALGTRHESKADDAPYDHGHDWITLDATGFRNDWCGPFTD